MAIQLGALARSARLDAFETDLLTGGAPVFRIFPGTQPANCAAADGGTHLVSFSMPADPFDNASGGVKAKSATAWTGTATTAGTAGHFRIYKTGGTTCTMQGSVTATGGGGDLTLDNASIAVSQVVTITGFTLTDGNA